MDARTMLGSPRASPPHFAGRREELAALGRHLDRLCATGDPTEGITLVTGVPGAGKTQLAREFTRQATRRDDGIAVTSTHIGTSRLTNPTKLFIHICRQMGGEPLGREIAELDSKTTGWNVGGAGVRGGRTREHVRHTSDLPDLLAESLARDMWKKKALVMVVDELQTIKAAGMEALRALHEGDHGCPIMLVGVGLQHTENVLAMPASGESGISRVARKLPLSTMCQADAEEAIGQGLRALGHSAPDESVTAMAVASHGFPQHIHGYLEGAVNALESHRHLQGQALREALSFGDKARVGYYEDRLKVAQCHEAMIALVAEMIRQGTDAINHRAAATALDAAGFDGKEAVDNAIKHGALSHSRDMVSFGIPSFHSYMRQEHARWQAQQRR